MPGFLITFVKALVPEDEKRGLAVWVKKPTSLAESFLVYPVNKDYWRKICGLEKMILIVENDLALPLGFLAYPRGEKRKVTFVDYICPVEITPVKEVGNWEAINLTEYRWQAECTIEYGNDKGWCIG